MQQTQEKHWTFMNRVATQLSFSPSLTRTHTTLSDDSYNPAPPPPLFYFFYKLFSALPGFGHQGVLFPTDFLPEGLGMFCFRF